MAAKYITTTLPYVNAKPHIGFATEILRADALARYYKLLGHEVFFNTGTDEHGQKIHEGAITEELDTQAYADKYAEEFKKLLPTLGISDDVHFIRTTDENHKNAAQEMWRRCRENGDIEKKLQTIKYCVGCELEKTDSELIEGKCPLHPNKELEIREEENYFFKFSNYGEKLLTLYNEQSHFVLPEFRLNEIKKFVEGGLQDFSISRLKEKMPWGVPVPEDEEHVMYVWFDALTNYISTLGWPDEEGDFKKFWAEGDTVQFAGKDNLRQQTAIWQAMLMSAGIKNTTQVVVGGFIISDGQKMSKSLGNVISPYDLVERYGTDATRYLLLRHVHPFEDTDVTLERLDEWYTANLVNGLGNLVARVMKMAETYLNAPVAVAEEPLEEAFTKHFDSFRSDEALSLIFEHVGRGDAHIQETEPFKLMKSENPADVEEAKKIIEKLVLHLYRITGYLAPFMPQTAEVIKNAIKENKKPDNLFARLES